MLWELFSKGSVPYPGISNNDAVEKVISGYRLYKPKECSDEIYSIMKQCWEEDPKARLISF